jgi:excisionase family DNA binding protein
MTIRLTHTVGALMSIKEACRYLGISHGKGYELIKHGEFPVSVRRVGSFWMVSRVELDDWLRTPQPAHEQS